MKTKKTVLLLLIGLVMPVLGVHAVDVSIRYHEQTVYFPESEIRVQITITNNTSEPFRFQLAERRFFNLTFDVRNLSNVALEAAPKLITDRLSAQPVLVREISLEPGERFSFVERLDQYVTLTQPAMYVVQAHFNPELIRPAGGATSAPRLTSNRLSLSVRPSPRTIDEEIAARIDHETGEILRRTPMPPDQVVAYTISARQRGQWDRFFLYLNVDELLRADPARERRFLNMSEEDQRREIDVFRRRLMEDTIDTQITAVPRSFEILRTTFGPQTGQVVADLRFPADGFTEVRRYTYYLQRRDEMWEIIRYDVNLVGTE